MYLKHGGDINILDGKIKTPLTCAKNDEVKKMLIKKLAKLKFEGHRICRKNLEFLRTFQNKDLNTLYENCLKELQQSKKS